MWARHPKYKTAKGLFIREFTTWKLSYLPYVLPKVVFICGGNPENYPNRTILEGYFAKHLPEILTFRAEDAWKVISQDSSYNALELEEWLAAFSDIIIILVESFGTVAELGAFSLSPNLRKKLLPILDRTREKDESFINTGPINWVNKDSKFNPSIQANFRAILTCIPEVEERLERRAVYNNLDTTYGIFRFSNKVMLFFLVYLISALGPIQFKEILSITSEITKYNNRKNLSYIVAVGVALRIFIVVKVKDTDYYTCVDFRKFFRSSSTQLFVNRILTSRARCLSSLNFIAEYRDVLQLVINNAA